MIKPVQAPRPAPPPAAAASGASRAYAEREAPQDDKLGTAHGQREWSAIRLVDFERATPYPQYTAQIEYDTYANLVARGVIRWRFDAQRHPQPFPASPPHEQYVPDPPGDP
jgi:hypothetical protein